jgi:hypothetical protein
METPRNQDDINWHTPNVSSLTLLRGLDQCPTDNLKTSSRTCQGKAVGDGGIVGRNYIRDGRVGRVNVALGRDRDGMDHRISTDDWNRSVAH